MCEEHKDVLLTAWENEQALLEKKEQEVRGTRCPGGVLAPAPGGLEELPWSAVAWIPHLSCSCLSGTAWEIMIQTPQPYPTPAPRAPEKVVLNSGCSVSFAAEEGEAGSGELEATGQGTADPGAAAAALRDQGQWVMLATMVVCIVLVQAVLSPEEEVG